MGRENTTETVKNANVDHWRYPLSVTCIGMWQKVSFGLGTTVAVPSVLVHSVEGHATGLHGSSSGGTQCSLGH